MPIYGCRLTNFTLFFLYLNFLIIKNKKMKKESLKKLSFTKLTISALTDSDAIVGGSGICGDISNPPEGCPKAKSFDLPNCTYTHQANGC